MVVTTGNNRLQRLMEDIFDSDSFQSRVKKLREKYQIPDGGFQDPGKSLVSIPEVMLITEMYVLKYPALDFHELMCAVSDYVIKYQEPYFADDVDLCAVDDIDQLLDRQEGDSGFQNADTRFPILIRVSPYASMRNIVDYIQKYKKEIVEAQKYFMKKTPKALPIKEYKNKKPERRQFEKFVYDNRDKSRNELLPLLRKSFPKFQSNFDQGSISKIISLERKRRQNM